MEAPSDYWTKVQTSIAGGAGPDLFFMNNVNYWSWAHRGVLYDMTELAAADDAMQDNIANSWQGAVNFYNYKGQQYGHAVHVHVHRPLLQRGLHRQQGLGAAGGH